MDHDLTVEELLANRQPYRRHVDGDANANEGLRTHEAQALLIAKNFEAVAVDFHPRNSRREAEWVKGPKVSNIRRRRP